MKRLLLLMLFYIPSGQAQVVVPACFPLINGAHATMPRHVSGELGQHLFWFCSPRGGTPREYGLSCMHGQCSANAMQAVHAAILSASAKVGAAQSAYTQSVSFTCVDVLDEQTPRGALCRERQRILHSMTHQWLVEKP
jgi:hypothetical protein